MSVYRDTLRSSRWTVLKLRKMRRVGFRCEGCGRKYMGPRRRAARFFNLHHLHYRTVGCETFADVALLCRECHQIEHGKVA